MLAGSAIRKYRPNSARAHGVALAIEGEETFDDPQQTPDTGPGAELFLDLACQRFSAGLQHFDAPAGQQPVVGAGNALQQHAAGAIGDPRDTEAEAGIADVVDDHIPRIAARSVRWRAAVFRSCRTGSNRSGPTANPGQTQQEGNHDDDGSESLNSSVVNGCSKFHGRPVE